MKTKVDLVDEYLKNGTIVTLRDGTVYCVIKNDIAEFEGNDLRLINSLGTINVMEHYDELKLCAHQYEDGEFIFLENYDIMAIYSPYTYRSYFEAFNTSDIDDTKEKLDLECALLWSRDS